jgi:lycopene cyclase domain-containing protein
MNHVPEYTVMAVGAAVTVVALDLRRWHSGLFRDPAYQATMGICLFFMILVNGWLTKLSAPIVIYSANEKTPWRFPLDIPVEDYFFGFTLLHLVLAGWVSARDDRDEAVERGRYARRQR